MNQNIDDKAKSAKHKAEQLWQTLKQERDEIRVKMHLAQSEVKDQWKELESQWEHLSQKMHNEKVKLEAASGAAKESNEEIGESLHQLMDDIKTGYHNVREKLR
ncbi:MAG: chromosome segregation ATPase [Porticoccus sp.]|jgi:chromosome segregation ATPase